MPTDGAAQTRICTMASEVKLMPVEPGQPLFCEGVASSSRLDRQAEVVNQLALHRAFQRSFERMGALPYLKAHNPENVLGKVVAFELRGDRMWTRAQLLPTEKSAAVSDLVTMLEFGIPQSQSIGFGPLPQAGRSAWDYSQSGEIDPDTKAWVWGGKSGDLDFDLLELSSCTLGANLDADNRLAKSLGFAYDPPWAKTEAGVAHPTLLVPDLGTPPAVPAPETAAEAKSGDSLSFAANVAEEAAERDAWQIIDGIWSALVDTIEAILASDADKAPLCDQLGTELAAELKRRLALPEPPESSGPWSITERAIHELSHRKASGTDKEASEEARFLADLEAAAGRWEACRNITRHWSKGGRVPSPEVLDRVLSSMGLPLELLKAGRVLSASNREAVTRARDACDEVLSRDDESRASAAANTEAAEEGGAKSILEAMWYGTGA